MLLQYWWREKKSQDGLDFYTIRLGSAGTISVRKCYILKGKIIRDVCAQGVQASCITTEMSDEKTLALAAGCRNS